MQNQQPQKVMKTQQQNHSKQILRQEGIKRKKQLEQKALQMGVSKSALKKLQKKQIWEQMKIQKRKQQREKERQKKKKNNLEKQQIRQKNQIIGINNEQQEQNHPFMRKRKDEYVQKMKDNLKVIIDLQFYDLMTQKQLNSLVKQLSYCHAINRKMQKPFNYILTSSSEARMKFIDQKYNGGKWGITYLQEVVHEAFNKQSLVYLTGDAQQQVQQFDENKIYIIGGIVDHNRLKKITYNYAKQHNIQMKRLPLKNIKLKSNVHLAVNHVWEWMLRRYNNQSWNQSLEKVLPQRKIQKIQEK